MWVFLGVKVTNLFKSIANYDLLITRNHSNKTKITQNVTCSNESNKEEGKGNPNSSQICFSPVSYK